MKCENERPIYNVFRHEAKRFPELYMREKMMRSEEENATVPNTAHYTSWEIQDSRGDMC